MKKVCVVGLGYIGLPTAIVAARHGLSVVGVDVDAVRVDRINSGDPVIQEPDIVAALHEAQATGHLKASLQIEEANYFVIAVPTPFKEGKKADLSYVEAAVDSVCSVLKKGDCVIVESTIPVGATMLVAELCEQATGLSVGKDFFVAHCPERVLPGKILYELVENDRIIGGVTQQCVEAAHAFYVTFVKGSLYTTDAKSAEMVKLVENSSRDVQIAFANQVASMAYSVGLDPYKIIELANKHPRVEILSPGCGVGGHCIAVDPWFLIESFPQSTELLSAARSVNDGKPQEVLATVAHEVRKLQMAGKEQPVIAVCGITYKADIDDIRESAALSIARSLYNDSSVTALMCDPCVEPSLLQEMFGSQAVSCEHAVNRADIVLYLVGHMPFMDTVKEAALKIVLDFCGITQRFKKLASLSETKELSFWPARSIKEELLSSVFHENGAIKEQSL